MNSINRKLFVFLIIGLFFGKLALAGTKAGETTIKLKSFDDKKEIERLIRQAQKFPEARRIEFVSGYLLGRKYRPETRARIKKQNRKKVEKKEANNENPLIVDYLRTNLKFLDCMTYVEHVLAIASAGKADYQSGFLSHLVDIMYSANGSVLMNHLRNHFTSQWADANEQKGYLVNIARNHKLADRRILYLNRVKQNRTFYVEDRFMIAKEPQIMWFFTIDKILSKEFTPESGDILALVTDKEGLDVTHMGFFIKKNQKNWFRHASLKLNRIVDQEFYDYMHDHKTVKGLMVMRPVLKAKSPAAYLFESTSAGK
jgi:hypothetical protein